VSTSPLSDTEQKKLAPTCSDVLLVENIGLDFGMWKRALEVVPYEGFDELILANSSVFGPFGSLQPIFDQMSALPCDFWGINDNIELGWHIQSYFLVFRKDALRSKAFADFWKHMLLMRTKDQVIRSYEVGLSTYLTESGLRAEVVAPLACLKPLPLIPRIVGGGSRRNPTVYHPIELIDLGMPFAKIELLRDNPARVDTTLVYERMRAEGYDLNLVEFDRAGRIADPLAAVRAVQRRPPAAR
jgi:rhamnosyltransferase